MDIAEGNSKRRRICDSAQDIGDYTGYKAFQIEESDRLNIRIVRIRNKTKTDNKEASSLEAAALTPRPTGQGKKRLTDEDDNGKKTITARATHLKNLTNETPCWFWKPEPDGKLGEGEAMSRSRFRQALKKKLKKRASLIGKTMKRRISEVTKKMEQLEQENKELREYASRLFATLQDVIQRQKRASC
ncbi:uncharacterized protein [Porites lutea]|uniref:uncharacterized protein n=1 Tax=Porites lutea TaxID=51062 RepID=UPI003CC5200E